MGRCCGIRRSDAWRWDCLRAERGMRPDVWSRNQSDFWDDMSFVGVAVYACCSRDGGFPLMAP